MILSSTSFKEGGAIPREHTCQGADRSPALSWAQLPSGTRSVALIVDDPDAPDPKAPKMTWVHWVLYDLPPSAPGLPEGGALPPGTREGLNDWKTTGYRGPCPPIGRHRYFHKLYALDALLPGLSRPTKAELERAFEGHVLGQAQLVGTYEKEPP
jgi:Raf kinase inhibitor-like YbhB/YbcL family protein